MLNKISIFLLSLFTFTNILLSNNIYYVSTNGNDSNNGSFQSPFKTLQMALNHVHPGDTIYIRGGVYDIETYIDVSGTKYNPITITSYPGEWAIFDGRDHPTSEPVKFRITGSYLIFKNFTVRNSPSDGILLTDGASHNILQNLRSYGNYFTGIEIEGGAGNNLVINCDSYLNFDYGETHGEHADGFGARYEIGEGNVFKYCRAWNNSDDGFDLWQASAPVLIDHCISYENGIDIWDTGNLFNGDGNGFKLGTGSPTICFCISFRNGRRGYDFNDSTEPEYVYNNTSYKNPVGFNFKRGRHVLINNLSYRDGTNYISYPVKDYANSWDSFPFLLPPCKPISNSVNVKSSEILNIEITDSDFISLDESEVKGNRKSDGSLTYSNFLRPSMDSAIRDIGIKLSYPFYGKSPDLGALEYTPELLYVPITKKRLKKIN